MHNFVSGADTASSKEGYPCFDKTFRGEKIIQTIWRLPVLRSFQNFSSEMLSYSLLSTELKKISIHLPDSLELLDGS